MSRFFNHGREAALYLLDGVLLFCLVHAAVGMRFNFLDFGFTPDVPTKAFIVALVAGPAFHFSGLYDFRVAIGRWTLLNRVLIGFIAASAILWAMWWTVPSVSLGRGIYGILLGIGVPTYYVWRVVVFAVMGNRLFATNILVLGAGDLAAAVAEVIETNHGFGYRLAGFLADDEDVNGSVDRDKVVGRYHDIQEVVREKGVDLLVVAIPERQAKLPMMELLHCKFAGVEVEDGLTFYEHHTDKLYVRELYPAWLVFNQGFRISPMTEAAKRIFDIAVSLVALVLTSPLIVLLGLVVALTSKGPMFFSQVRTGRFGKDFKIYKLRSMRMDTGEDVGDGRSSAAEAPDTWNPDTDRITLIGRIMRRLHLDELPQFWNVLIGNMAVVGPRPERPEYIARLENSIPFYTQRHLVKPGVTGLAQVMYDYGASVEGSMEKLQYDLCYIRHLSISSDVLTVLRTLRVVLFGRERR